MRAARRPHAAPSQSISGSQQGCGPRAGKRSPWERELLIYPRGQNSLFQPQHTPPPVAWLQGSFPGSCQVFTRDLGPITR